MNRRHFAAALIALAIASPLRSAEMPEVVEYGHLRGRFVYDGEPPLPKPFIDKGLLVGHSENLLVNPTTLGIANLGVWLEPRRGEPLPPIHPSYGMHAAKPDGPRTKKLAIAGSRFEPHIVLLRTDEVLVITNTDKVPGNAKFEMINNPSLNPLLPPAAEKREAFVKPERIPTHISSAIHPWMRANILVKDHPYFAVTDSDGNFEIRNLPAGEREFRCWHEVAGYITAVKREDVPQKWMAGRVKLTIPADDTLDLGEIEVSPTLFR